MAIASILGVEGCTAAKINGVERGNIDDCNGADYGACAATRWMAGGNQGRVFTTSASNGLNGWGDGTGTNGSIVDLGNGNVETVAYGNADADGDPPRWICGLNLKTGTKGAIAYINSSSAHEGESTFYATASNWTSASAPELNDGFQGRQGLAYGNEVWMAAGKEQNVSGDYRSFYRSTDYGASWTRLAESNDENDEAMAMCYKGTGNTWMAAHGRTIWKSTDNGANWAKTFTGSMDGSGATSTWHAVVYDGARWMIAGGSGDAWYSDDDGTTWVDQSARMGTSKNIYGMVYMKGTVNRWICVMQDGVAKSQTNAAIDADEDNWTNMLPPDSTTMNAIATDHTTAVAVGQSGRIWVTTNGTSWTAADRSDNVGTNALKSIACDIIGSGLYK